MPVYYTNLTWEEDIKRRRENMDAYFAAPYSKSLYIERPEMKEQKKIQRRLISGHFNFLQYTGLVYRWACTEYNLRRIDLDFILYLYPIGIFTTGEFSKLGKMYGVKDFRRFDRFKNNGYIVFHSNQDTGKSGRKYKVWFH